MLVRKDQISIYLNHADARIRPHIPSHDSHIPGGYDRYSGKFIPATAAGSEAVTGMTVTKYHHGGSNQVTVTLPTGRKEIWFIYNESPDQEARVRDVEAQAAFAELLRSRACIIGVACPI